MFNDDLTEEDFLRNKAFINLAIANLDDEEHCGKILNAILGMYS